ncbi:MAG: SLC13/DASS family transporter [Deltaproteobacteria bacterium]|jgi:sodium-dependent dicarboxylate transporter 2/3/5|nr:SLC13/DASS family transporter [Deltaproteobacteria bacterium]MBW2537355.1 SLC13/DASS family transporter [Deltaproteobacteria bacterium]
MTSSRGSASSAEGVVVASPDGEEKQPIDVKRWGLLLLGVALFVAMYLAPQLGDAVDPNGKSFALSYEGKTAIALFLLAATWWVTEAVPIGITAITIGIVQAIFINIKDVRTPRDAFTDFMDPSVWFIFGSLIIGLVFTKTGLTRRLAYKMLAVVGEKTSMIYLGCFVMTSALTLIMAHTAVAATIFPLLMAIYGLYTDEDKPTKFGKGLFMGMAYVAGAGSIITLLGAARGAVALGFYRDITGKEVSFFELSYYMAPIGIVMTFVLWAYFMVYYKPEKKTIPGLRERVKVLNSKLGPIKRDEILALVIVLAAIAILSLRSFIPALAPLNKSAVILTTTVLFFVFNILKLEDLEQASWNIILLFGGAMSIGFCLWHTGAAEWMAIHWLTLFVEAPWFAFVLGMAFFVLLMTNFIMNVAAIAISMPVAFVIAPYMHVDPEVVLFASLVTAGMPFLLLVGAAPNAIAYASKQFTSKEFFVCGLPASAILMVVLAFFVWLVWPMMGMPVLTTG